MGLNALHLNEVARLNMSASARITQALKVNDLGTAQRIAASVAMGGGHHLKQSLAQTTPRPKDHQVDVLA
jgi:hypothetical protein